MDRRTSESRALGAPPADGFDAEIIEGIEFNYRREPHCLVCKAEADTDLVDGVDVRQRIDFLLTRNWAYQAVFEDVAERTAAWPERKRPGYASIRRHALRHLKPEELAIREIMERRARDSDQAIVATHSPIVSAAGAIESIARKGLDGILDGEVSVSPAVALHAFEVVHAIDREAKDEADVGELRRQVGVFFRIVRSQLSNDQWLEIATELESQGIPDRSRRPRHLLGGDMDPEVQGAPADPEVQGAPADPEVQGTPAVTKRRTKPSKPAGGDN